jgi:hypothetical protein
MKFTLSGTLAILVFMAPLGAWGAYNDVTLTTDTVLSVGGVTINVSGSSAAVESIVVDTSSFNVTLLPSSTITVTTANREELNVNTESYTTSSSCDTLTLAGSGSTVIVTVTPDAADTCSTAGGGGSSSSSNKVDSSISALMAKVSELRALLAQLLLAKGNTTASVAVSGAFTSDLTAGSSSPEVKTLQVYLNAKGFTVSMTGAGSAGNETMLFGAATKAALAKFQAAKGITPSVGFFGPKTRAYVNANP